MFPDDLDTPAACDTCDMQQTTAVAMPSQRAHRTSTAVSTAVRRLVDDRGEVAAIQQLSLSRMTVARLYGGMPVQPATLIVAAQRLGVALGETMPAEAAVSDDGGDHG